MKTIITHSSPDYDAITFIWLMMKFEPNFNDAQIQFMPLSAIDQQVLNAADAVGDIGGKYDQSTLRFDHHHFPGAQATSTCAAKMAWEWLISQQGLDLKYLAPLIEEIHQGDLARTPLVGLHSQMFGWKASAREADIILSDQEIFSYGAHCLNQIEFWLKHKAENRIALADKVVWKSKDNLIWAIRGGSASLSFAAYDEGAKVVIFQGTPINLSDGNISYPMGASRAPEWQEPDLGKLVQYILANHSHSSIYKELSRWFRHQAGFFTGRGGEKAPDTSRPLADLIEIAKKFDKAWRRDETT